MSDGSLWLQMSGLYLTIVYKSLDAIQDDYVNNNVYLWYCYGVQIDLHDRHYSAIQWRRICNNILLLVTMQYKSQEPSCERIYFWLFVKIWRAGSVGRIIQSIIDLLLFQPVFKDPAWAQSYLIILWFRLGQVQQSKCVVYDNIEATLYI